MFTSITDSKIRDQRPLRDYIRMVLTFFICLVLLSVLQQFHLYRQGVLDSVINKSLLILVVHHTGFASLAGIILAFIFKFLESVKKSLGLFSCGMVFIFLLFSEILTTLYFTEHHEMLGSDFIVVYLARYTSSQVILRLGLGLSLGLLSFLVMYRLVARVYHLISRMYPFTLVLLSIFLATLMSHKNPVNENKTQHLLENALTELMDWNAYQGEAEYPLLRPKSSSVALGPYFKLGAERPNLVFLVIDGLGADFLGTDAKYAAFTPFLSSLSEKSLHWDHFLSNQGTNYAAVPSITGSLPFGTRGFTKIDQQLNRHTLFSLLQENGYRTSFYYGGNTALHQMDRFLFEEGIDEIIGRKNFGRAYQQQPEDEAGISKGYPDKALFAFYHSEKKDRSRPRLEVFQTLSSSKPFNIPQKQVYVKKVRQTLASGNYQEEIASRISRNSDIFASILYMDDAVRHFIQQYKANPEFDNTIFIITGSHNLSELPQESNIDRYRVPLIMYSPLIKEARKFSVLASHADIVPALLGLLGQDYPIKQPSEVAWLGDDLLMESDHKTIPLFRYQNGIEDFIMGSHFWSNGDLYKIGPSFTLTKLRNHEKEEEVESAFQYFKAVNRYVTMQNKLIPPVNIGLNSYTSQEFSNEDQIWIQSIFNGEDYDKAYGIAREIAFQGDWDRADLLCRYILDKVPGHADTEILMGRIAAWQGKYEPAERILSSVVRKYPVYSDGYAALLDAYYWSGKHSKALELKTGIEKYHPEDHVLNEKLQRASTSLRKQLLEKSDKSRHKQVKNSITAKI
ncbi:sulfatase-like hydrolase/transferase [Zeaxanthinibacter sp. PT1]|uniref:sulfatase-like hydrolase/transferase n=1 Tax=Zeaxanthinibacter TaxID=561554 RepID=UPI00234AA2E8|nr:sulfatase-like hydrolase/transferase [Zeaxanthinibacter sp. PT1]MDC6351535.1 sulfatase-like hydrolase/transferase [Zeaxanthinibacter sp. PT1]